MVDISSNIARMQNAMMDAKAQGALASAKSFINADRADAAEGVSAGERNALLALASKLDINSKLENISKLSEDQLGKIRRAAEGAVDQDRITVGEWSALRKVFTKELKKPELER